MFVANLHLIINIYYFLTYKRLINNIYIYIYIYILQMINLIITYAVIFNKINGPNFAGREKQKALLDTYLLGWTVWSNKFVLKTSATKYWTQIKTQILAKTPI